MRAGRAARVLVAMFPLVVSSACQTGRVSPAKDAQTPPPTEQGRNTRPAASAERPCPLPSSDPLCPLNSAFRDAYAERRAAMLAASGPVLVQYGDTLVLLRRGERLEGPATNERYHELKSVAHVPFALYLLLSGVDGPIDEARLGKLISYEALVRAALSTIDGRFPDAAQRERQQRILTRSLALLDQATRERRLASSTLGAFIRSQRADVLENIREAAHQNVMTLHAQVTAWAARLTPEERARLRVVIGTPHMARPGNISLQYFAAWLGEPSAGRAADERIAEGTRIIVAENIFDADRSMALVGTHLVDRAAAAAFFDDPLRLDRDLLSDAAEEAIHALFGGSPAQKTLPRVPPPTAQTSAPAAPSPARP
ncbi:hypothetical protein [Polyangium sp. y55x31]|uniref:hypothetical protein n=1 Tax=Polyangium sp. y55x31 TaxID=3042688 RepID=UPI0024828EF8|nr:hypothetical protein [Polyangium sp. y55x31]MDI1476519.1 hypothetical protein [Polyangium sp. y55x31]